MVGGKICRSVSAQSSLVMMTSSQPPSRCVGSATCWVSRTGQRWPESRFENSEKTAHSSVEYQMCLSNALITALETCVMFLVNNLNHATTAAAGHCRESHHQKMSSVTFQRHRNNHVFAVAHLITERKHFCCASSTILRCPGTHPMHILLRHLCQK